MKLLLTSIYIIFSFLFLIYLAIPNINFPNQILDSRTSYEPADTETTLRKGYFTDFSRGEVLTHYKNEFVLNIFGYKLKPLELNYPPEEAQTLIRDQTRSTFLEELVFPFRESIYINGFEPKEDKDAIVVDGVRYRQKIIVKSVSSNVYVRFIIGIATIVFVGFYLLNLSLVINKVKKSWKS